MSTALTTLGASDIAARVRRGDVTAEAVATAFLARIARLDPVLNAFTDVRVERAIAAAQAIDLKLARGEDVGPLTGVPFAAKNLFDIRGLTTRAGSRINRDLAPADADAPAVARLERAGGVLLGALNMAEYAYGFVTDNVHDGRTSNPLDLTRTAGGSSGGSAAAVSARLAPLTLGTDTGGSIRVPAAMCGVFGLKPTFGRLPTEGVFPLSAELDHAGVFARNVADLALAFHTLVAPTAPPDAAAERPWRAARLSGWFDGASAAVRLALDTVCDHLQVRDTVTLTTAAAARSATALVTAADGGALHLERLRQRFGDFDPATATRLCAGALVPHAARAEALRVRPAIQRELRGLFSRFDVLLAPTLTDVAPPHPDGVPRDRSAPRVDLGRYTQPFNLAGVPIVSVPVAMGAGLPAGIQAIAAPMREDIALAVAGALERAGIAAAAQKLAPELAALDPA